LFGSLLSIRNDPHLALHRIAQQYGDICQIRLGGVPTVIISHPDLLKEAFDKSELADRWVSQVMGILSHHGQDLALAPYGEHWRQLQRFANRELLSLRNLQQIRERFIEDVINGLVEEIGARSDAGQLIAPIELLSRSNATIMFRSIFGRSGNDTAEFEARREELLRFVYWAFQNASAANPADYLPWLKILPSNAINEAEKQAAVRDEILQFLIDSVRSRPDLDLENPTCLIEVMLAKERQGELTKETIRLLMGDLLLAGIDTSAQTVSWLLLILANRPEIRSKIHEELDRVIGAEQLVVVEDRERLPYLNAAILEDMRYRTVGPLALPHKASQTCEIGGFSIAEGAQVLGNIYSIHHDPRFWDTPDEFLPERFLPNADGSPAPALAGYAFIPFGVGHRACPGRRFGEVLVWLHASRLLHRFQFQVADPAGGTLSEEEVFGLTVGPKPYELQVTRR
ncbi:MAG: cytochrome P450, partial [Dehalococcoidia bacterium]